MTEQPPPAGPTSPTSPPGPPDPLYPPAGPAPAFPPPPWPATGPAPVPPAWRRLDPRTLLTGPVTALKQAGVPLLAGVIGISTSSPVSLVVVLPLAVLGAALLGALPWLTTTFRLTETHLEVRRGVLNRSTLTARLDRVRGVELEANLLHRLLGITKVRVGTGVDEGQIALDALGTDEAEELRRTLLRAAPAPAAAHTSADQPAVPGVVPEPAAPVEEITRLDWGWVRFAPLNLANAAVVLTGLGVLLSQVGDLLPRGLLPDAFSVRVDGSEQLHRALLGVVAVAVVLLVLWVPVSCVGYAIRWGGLRVTREEGREGTVLRRTWGLLTTRSSTVEESKVRGATLTTPLLVGLAGGAELSLLTTGLEDNQPDVLPTAPRDAVVRVAVDVLDDAEAVHAPLTAHGAATRRRYRFRALVTAAVLGGLFAIPTAALDLSWWLPAVVLVLAAVVGLPLAALRYRHLGHRVTGRYLVAQTGALRTVRTALESDSIVGWRVRQTYWDRRRGLAQLTATTAAGPEQVGVPDVPLGEAVALAAAATPRTVSDFLEPAQTR